MTEKNPFFGATFAERKASREAAEKAVETDETKAVDSESKQVEDKAMSPAKTTRKRATKKP